MSASLVGSEMCIRDRLGPLARLRPQPSPDGRWPPTRFQPRGCSGAWLSVSYTHLTLPTICSV
eukprot:1358035-Alexandrium_andersonii.AAC.1